MSTLGDAALRLVRKGIAVFPLRPRTKEPYGDDKFFRTKGGCKCATRDPSLVEFWWSRQPDANIGGATGSSFGIWVLDTDGDEGRETLATLEEKHGQLPKTVEVITPGKISKKSGENTGRGLHDYFRWPLGRDITNAQLRDDVPGIDWRGNGGYVLLPPSVHPDGTGKYEWSVDSADTFADAPEWLIELVTSKPGRSSGGAHTPEHWRTAVDKIYTGSSRGQFLASLAGKLFRAGHLAEFVLGLIRNSNIAQCEPPLPDSEVVGIVARIKRREDVARDEQWAPPYAEPDYRGPP